MQQIQQLCGADDNPWGRRNAESDEHCDPHLTQSFSVFRLAFLNRRTAKLVPGGARETPARMECVCVSYVTSQNRVRIFESGRAEFQTPRHRCRQSARIQAQRVTASAM